VSTARDPSPVTRRRALTTLAVGVLAPNVLAACFGGSTKQAEKDAHKGKSHGHKIRYIVGGVLVIVIVLVGGVLLYNRRGGRD